MAFPSGSQSSPTGVSATREGDLRLRHTRTFVNPTTEEPYTYVDGNLECEIFQFGNDPTGGSPDLTLNLSGSDQDVQSNFLHKVASSMSGGAAFYHLDISVSGFAVGPVALRWTTVNLQRECNSESSDYGIR